jgi:hypothetical protein
LPSAGYDELENGGLHHRQVGRLLTLKNAAGIDADLANPFGLIRSVAHQANVCGFDYGVAPPGRRTVNTEPLPGSLVTVTSPPEA